MSFYISNLYNVHVVTDIYIYMTVVVRSAVTGPDPSRVLICQQTEVPCHR